MQFVVPFQGANANEIKSFECCGFDHGFDYGFDPFRVFSADNMAAMPDTSPSGASANDIPAEAPTTITADIVDASGKKIGDVKAKQTKKGVEFTVNSQALRPECMESMSTRLESVKALISNPRAAILRWPTNTTA